MGQQTAQRSEKEVQRELERIERFRKIAGHRSNKALDYIEALLRTSDRARYSYTDEQVNEIVGKLKQATDQLAAAYSGQRSARLRVDLLTQTVEIVPSLSPLEQARLAELEQVIEHGLGTFFEVGMALTEIRTSQPPLYLEVAPTFAAYCELRWGYSERHAQNLMRSAKVALATRSIERVIPSEAVARELAPFLGDNGEGNDVVADLWERVVKAWTVADACIAGGRVTWHCHARVRPARQQPMSEVVRRIMEYLA